MKKYKTEKELLELARPIAEYITVMEGKGSLREAKTIPTTEAEKQILLRVTMGTLEGMNWGEETRGNTKTMKAIIDAGEFILLNLMIGNMRPGYDINTYDTLYRPLLKILKDWEEQ